EGNAGVDDRLVAISAMKQCLAETAAEHCPFVLANGRVHQIAEASVRGAAVGNQGSGTGADRGIGYLFSVDQLRGTFATARLPSLARADGWTMAPRGTSVVNLQGADANSAAKNMRDLPGLVYR